jgi:Mrp family chromosome partitioning ATPase
MHNIGGPELTRVGVASAVRGEGRSSIATGIAAAQARDYGRSVLLIDADFDGPELAERFGLASAPGVSEVLSGHAGVNDALRPVSDGVTVMSSGEIGPAPARLAAALVQSNLLDELQGEYDVVVLDLPAIRRSSSGQLLCAAIHPLVLVVRADQTPLSEVREAVELLDEPPVVMLNGTSSRVPRWARE